MGLEGGWITAPKSVPEVDESVRSIGLEIDSNLMLKFSIRRSGSEDQALLKGNPSWGRFDPQLDPSIGTVLSRQPQSPDRGRSLMESRIVPRTWNPWHVNCMRDSWNDVSPRSKIGYDPRSKIRAPRTVLMLKDGRP